LNVKRSSPDAQRGIAVCGGPGSGKTFSVIDPAVRSAINQGFPIILYDFKYPSQTSRIAGYAAENGYNVRVFAPGYPESDVCNPLDFLKEDTDSLMARQMAEVLNKNFSTGGANKSEDPFFTQAGDQLTEGFSCSRRVHPIQTS
jgi:type IV secretory pathway TraG/TraD family ATPase VirD4